MTEERRERVEKIAEEIVADLFMNGSGMPAERLVLTSSNGKDLGGWCRKSVRNRIVQRLGGRLLASERLSEDEIEQMWDNWSRMQRPLHWHDVDEKAAAIDFGKYLVRMQKLRGPATEREDGEKLSYVPVPEAAQRDAAETIAVIERLKDQPAETHGEGETG